MYTYRCTCTCIPRIIIATPQGTVISSDPFLLPLLSFLPRPDDLFRGNSPWRDTCRGANILTAIPASLYRLNLRLSHIPGAPAIADASIARESDLGPLMCRSPPHQLSGSISVTVMISLASFQVNEFIQSKYLSLSLLYC